MMNAGENKPRMEDDSNNPTESFKESYGPQLLFEMSKIAQHRIMRWESQRWAKDLLFIVYDDQELPGCTQEKPCDTRKKDSEDSKAESCSLCRSLPSFPDSRAKHFRLVRSSCEHFLAVSYCWPKTPDGHPASVPQTYTYLYENEDGNIEERQTRPPDSVVDRAVAYARLHEIKLIWIDQVCLPQDQSNEHQLGIQSIDMVYQRAKRAVGLFDTIIKEQRQLNALSEVLQWTTSGTLGGNDRTGSLLTELLVLLANDPWNTRAWILQESFAAHQKMDVLVRTAEGVHFSDREGTLRLPQPLPNTFIFALKDIHKLAKLLKGFLSFVSFGCHQAGLGFIGDALLRQGSLALSKLNQMHPVSVIPKGLSQKISAEGGNSFGPRTTCNAATAITYMKSRKSYPAVERLAIMANLCGFEVRLDTRKVQKYPSLSTAYFTLALMNGDLSLLNPDLYTSMELAPAHCFRWCPPFKAVLNEVESRVLRPGSLLCVRNPIQYILSKKGFRCPAVLWDVNTKVDLSVLRDKWKPTWKDLLVDKVCVKRFESEGDADYAQRAEDVSQYCQEHPERVSNAEKDEYLRENTIRLYFFDLSLVKDKTKTIDRICRMFSELLVHLCTIGYDSLANSIWSSIRQASIDTEDETERELPEKVEDVRRLDLFSQDPAQLMCLDPDHASTLHQMWFIQRVIRDGFVWAGRGLSTFVGPKDNQLELGSQQEPLSSSKQRHTHSGKAENEDSEHRCELPLREDTILGRAMLRQLMMNVVQAGVELQNPEIPSSSITEFLMTCAQSYSWDDIVRQQLVTFDVDGPCIIATPRDPDRERLPHPPERAMRISWVVIPDSGMDQQQELSISSLSLVKDPVPELHPVLPGDDVSSTDRYKVQSSVKGFWPLLENTTRFSYTFV